MDRIVFLKRYNIFPVFSVTFKNIYEYTSFPNEALHFKQET